MIACLAGPADRMGASAIIGTKPNEFAIPRAPPCAWKYWFLAASRLARSLGSRPKSRVHCSNRRTAVQPAYLSPASDFGRLSAHFFSVLCLQFSLVGGGLSQCTICGLLDGESDFLTGQTIGASSGLWRSSSAKEPPCRFSHFLDFLNPPD